MRKLIYTVFCVCTLSVLWAQNYGDQWINYDQYYYKFAITNNGMHRIDYTTLQAAFIALGQHDIDLINPQNIQIFGKGEQLAIHIEGEADGSFDPTDYIEFYAQKNDGWLDTTLYGSRAQQSNPYYSLFSDTIYYFLSLNNSTSNKRLITINSDPINNGLLEPYYWESDVTFFNNRYYAGTTNTKKDPNYTLGEGWFSNLYREISGVLSVNFNTPNIYSGPGAPSAYLDYFIKGRNEASKHVNVQLNANTIFDSTIFASANVVVHDTISGLSAATQQLNFDVLEDNDGKRGYIVVAYAALDYPASFSLPVNTTNQLFTLENNASNDYHLNISGFSNATTTYLYDLTDGYRIAVNLNSSNIEVVVPASTNQSNKICYLTTDANYTAVSAIDHVTESGQFVDYGLLTPDSGFLIVTNKKLSTSALEYADYKNTSGHNAFVFYIDELSDQFASGVPSHAIGIKNLCRKLYNLWPSKPKHLFLLGKAIMDEGQSFRKNNTFRAQNLVPSYSWPANDFNFVEGLAGTPNVPEIPVGRLAAQSNAEVLDYLDKVMAHELALSDYQAPGNISEELWHKNVLHFGGGGDTSEQAQFRNYLENYASIISDTCYGANVRSFYKSTADPIDFNLSDSIKTIINNGAAFLSFFGHSSAGSFDIAIDNAASYNNQDKYFFLLSNGCLSGDISQIGSGSLSEDFVLTPNKGAIAFIAQADQGIGIYLNSLSVPFYQNLTSKHYGKPVGLALQEASKQLVLENPSHNSLRATAFEAVYHGDPSMCMTKNTQVDYALIEPAKVWYTPENISTAMDSFQMHVVAHNIGKIDTSDLLQISVRRFFPDGTDTLHNFGIDRIVYSDTLHFTFAVNPESGVGNNQFEIHIDPSGFIQERSEFNNKIEVSDIPSLSITSNDLVPVYPSNYAVIDSVGVTLKASTADPMAPLRDYIFQIDTTDLFNSSLLQQQIVSSEGGVVAFTPNLPITGDSIVYFWRCAATHPDPDSVIYRERSFQYINQKNGWGQDHFFQFKNDQFNGLNYIRQSKEISFDTTGASLFVNLVGNQWTKADFSATEYKINGVRQGQSTCGWGAKAFLVSVIDPVTLEPWYVADILDNGDTVNYPQNDFGNGNNLDEPNLNNCNYASPGQSHPAHTTQYFNFMTPSAEQMDSMASMLNNKIPNGHYLLIYTVQRPAYQSDANIQNSGIKAALNNLGSFALDTLPDGYPWIFFTKVGDPSTTIELAGSKMDTTLVLNTAMRGLDDQGSITSTLIGPAQKWHSLSYNYPSTEGVMSDSVELQILSENNQVLHQLTAYSAIDTDISGIVNADQHPYIKLRVNLKDDQFNYPAQNDSWHVLFDAAPEAAIDFSGGFYLEKDTLNQGDSLRFAVLIQNIAEVDFDSLRVSYKIVSNASGNFDVPYALQAPLLVGENLFDTVVISTQNISGLNQLFVEVNPQDSLWQIEQEHFNNLLSIPFFVREDRANPILDVTFDGMHIIDGEIVSPRPKIDISLKDENTFLALDEIEDTANFQMSLTYPNGTVMPIYFSNTSQNYAIDYNLASTQNNVFDIQLIPNLSEDGIYTLSVQGWDKSGNKSGKVAYEISFEVILESSITQVMNYPNPFTTKTQFVFTLTGSEIPEVFKIQILSATGKLVREITKEELGALRIGRNITDFAWDGTDRYGDRLANGVYLYRVITSINGENIKNRASNADQFFHKSFGKMYLMR